MRTQRQTVAQRRWLTILTAALLMSGCTAESGLVTYVCDEPLEPYLDQARQNIANDYEVDRSHAVLANCPDKGFHRRYTFSFLRRHLASTQPVDAQVEATWCNDADTRRASATASLSPTALVFDFTYPWSTATGKYPRTEFRLNRNTLKGGFFEKLDWTCRLEQNEVEPAE